MKLQRRLSGAIKRRIYALQDSWLADASAFPATPNMVGCATYKLELRPWMRRPNQENMPPEVCEFAPGSRLRFTSPYSSATWAEQEAWSSTHKFAFGRLKFAGPAPA